MMRYVLLGRTTLEVSVLALGCGNFGGVGSAPELFGLGDDEASAVALMDAARENGITLFDTANSYGGGRSEEWVGRWLRSRGARDEVVLTTKVRSPGRPARSTSSRGTACWSATLQMTPSTCAGDTASALPRTARWPAAGCPAGTVPGNRTRPAPG